LLYTVRIGPVSDGRAAALANALSVGGFPQAQLVTETGYRVVSEPLARYDADSLAARLAGRGITSSLGPTTGNTVQVLFGVFTSRKDAEALSLRIANAGYDAWIRTGTVYTLRLGPSPSSSVSAITRIVKAGDPEASVTADPVVQP
jgi:cell division protein FtsN